MSRKSSINKIKRDNSKSKNIESNLIMYLYEKKHSPISSKVKISGLQECDVISVSKSDYIYEYEIKISRGDFKKDFIKEKHNHILNEKFTYTRKGELLFRVCNYFNYIVKVITNSKKKFSFSCISKLLIYNMIVFFFNEIFFEITSTDFNFIFIDII